MYPAALGLNPADRPPPCALQGALSPRCSRCPGFTDTGNENPMKMLPVSMISGHREHLQ